VANALRIYQLKVGIADCKRGGLDMVEFYNKLVSLRSELKNLVKIPYYTCNGCKCEVSSKISRMFDEENHINSSWA